MVWKTNGFDESHRIFWASPLTTEECPKMVRNWE